MRSATITAMAIPSSDCPPATELLSEFNRYCRCTVVDESDLARELEKVLPRAGLYRAIQESRPHLFSPIAVFVARADVERMRAVIAAVERVIATPEFRTRVLAWADPIAAFEPGSPGVFSAYDFHLGPDGPKLIEINTNAGGALLNAALVRAARACCPDTHPMAVGAAEPMQLEATFMETFQHEWHAQRGDAALGSIAIVDDEPTTQYLYPEFQLFENLFERHGIRTVVADAASLIRRDGRLCAGELPIDLVYNRLTDFALAQPPHAALHKAYLEGLAVVTPHPRAYALYADKRNLTLLTDESFLRSLSLSTDSVTTLLNGIPRTLAVTEADAATFWAQRKRWFFKPATGFGSRAAYRGDKLTRRVFEEISKGGYVAQARVDPAERANLQEQEPPYKFDLRCYVYNAEVQLLVARLYHGQTTNFRTPGGGFAPVFFGA